MKLGAFIMPSHPPERPIIDGIAGISSSWGGSTDSASTKLGLESTSPRLGNRTRLRIS